MTSSEEEPSAELAERVERLEEELSELKTWARDFSAWSTGAPGQGPSQPPPIDTGVSTDEAAVTTKPEAEETTLPPSADAQWLARNQESEVRLVGTWFARVGALVLLLGVALAFVYAVEQNLIGPRVRVTIGLVAGILVLVAGELTRRREWSGPAQALSAGGLGILYLSVWASYQLYGLLLLTAAFLLIGVITIAGVIVAIRHDSQALAFLALIGGFLNPLLLDDWTSVAPTFGYLIVLDAGVLALGVVRRWRLLEWLALTGSWFFVGIQTTIFGGGQFSPFSFRFFATLFWALFLAHSFAAELSARRETQPGDQGFAVSNALAYFSVSMVLLEVGEEPWRTEFTLGLAAIYGVLGFVARRLNRAALSLALFGAAVVFVTILIPIAFRGPWIATAWAVQGVMVIWFGRRQGLRLAQRGGVALLSLSLMSSLALLGENYLPARLLISAESFALLVQIAALYLVAWMFSGSERDRMAVSVSVVAANLVTVAWLTFEAFALFRRTHPPIAGYSGIPLASILDDQGPQLTISAIWALYAAGVMAAGVAYRARSLRLFGVGLFGATLLKVLFKDVWFLDPLFRTVALIGLGILLLLSSLLYNRFREIILGSDESAATSSGPGREQEPAG